MTTTAAAAGDGGTVVVAHPGWYGGFWGFPFFGLFFVILFFAIIFGLIRRAAWGGRGDWGGGWGGWHGYGPHGRRSERARHEAARPAEASRRGQSRCSRTGTATHMATPATSSDPRSTARRAGIASPPWPTILVADDSPEILRITRDYLEHAGFTVLTATDGAGALRLAHQREPDLVVLDLSMPGMDGLDVARAIRRESALPIIMLTARADESDTLVGLELGADDYVTKPFSPKELVARVRAVLRRTSGAAQPAERVVVGRLSIDVPRMAVSVDGRAIDLTPDRVPAARHHGAPARSRLHAIAAPRRGPRHGLRVVRARDRRAHQEPATKARAGRRIDRDWSRRSSGSATGSPTRTPRDRANPPARTG